MKQESQQLITQAIQSQATDQIFISLAANLQQHHILEEQMARRIQQLEAQLDAAGKCVMAENTRNSERVVAVIRQIHELAQVAAHPGDNTDQLNALLKDTVDKCADINVHLGISVEMAAALG